MAGGWVAVVIILVIALIGGFIATIFNSNGDADYDTSQIPNSEIILDENGNQDGTSNKCAERMYSFDDVQVMGYGSPKYE